MTVDQLTPIIPPRQSGGHSNSFSKASFALSTGAGGAAGGANAVSVDDNDFWEKVGG
jgi:hypothetical protein